MEQKGGKVGEDGMLERLMTEEICMRLRKGERNPGGRREGGGAASPRWREALVGSGERKSREERKSRLLGTGFQIWIS